MKRTPASRIVALALLAIAIGFKTVSCDGGGLGGCGGDSGCAMQQIPPPGFPLAERIENAAQVRLTDHGIIWAEDNLVPLLEGAMGEGGLSFDIPTVDAIGIATICPNGCTISISIQSVDITPIENSNRIRATIVLPPLNVPIAIRLLWGLGNCTTYVHSSGNPVPINAEVTLLIDPQTKELSFEISQPEFDLNQLQIGNGSCFGIQGLANTLLPLFHGMIRDEIAKALDEAMMGFLCMKCPEEPTDPPCPAGSNCSDGYCMTGNNCIKNKLGLEGQLDLTSLGASLLPGLALKGTIQFSVVAGGYAESVIGGVNLGVLGGVRTPVDDLCVQHYEYVPNPAPRVPFGNENPHIDIDPNPNVVDNPPYAAGIGLAESFLDRAMAEVYNSGALCITLDNTMPSIGQYLSLSNFSLLMGSINMYTHGEEPPVMLKLRLSQPPDIDIGAGTTETGPDGTIRLIEPLLKIQLRNANLDLYSLIDDRFVRLFTIQLDLIVGAALDQDQDGNLVVLLGDSPIGLENIRIPFSILAEDPVEMAQGIEDLIGGLIGQIPLEIPPIEIPPIDINSDDMPDIYLVMQSISPELPYNDGSGRHRAFAIYADIMSQPPTRTLVDTSAFASEVVIPTIGQIRQRKAVPRVTLELEGAGPSGARLEYSYRVDNAGWSLFTPSQRITLRNREFLLQGRHRIEVRARVAGDPYSLDTTPATVVIDIDYLPPAAVISRDGATVTCRDTAPNPTGEPVLFSFRVGSGAWTDFGADDRLTLDAGLAGREVAVQCRIRDAAGLEDQAAIRFVPTTSDYTLSSRGLTVDGGSGPLSISAGCSGGAGTGLASLLILALALLLRRRTRALAGLALLMAVAVGTACPAGTQTDGDEDGDVAVDGDEDGDMIVDGDEEEAAPNRCQDQSDCLANQYCSRQGECKDQACMQSADCAAQHQGEPVAACYACDTSEKIYQCRMPRCGSDADCGCIVCDTARYETPACESVSGACVCNKPCGGDCPTGKSCCFGTNECTVCPGFCEGLSCEPGYEGPPEPQGWVACGTFNQETCQNEGEGPGVCRCVEKPWLEQGFIGRYAEGAYYEKDGEGYLVFSAYNEGFVNKQESLAYGDLMFGAISVRALQTPGSPIDWEFVDGVPWEVEPEYGPNGPRMGISQPGDDVGRYTSIAVDQNGNPRISYYDATHRSLKFAFSNDDLWISHTVEQLEGERAATGLYTRLLLDPQGRPVIIYMTANDGAGNSALKIAAATTVEPTSASDWNIIAIDQAPVPPAACGGACDQTCLYDPGTGDDICVDPQGDCAEDCVSDVEECHNGVCMKVRVDSIFTEMLPGTGLFVDAVFSPFDGRLTIVWYTHTRWNPPDNTLTGDLMLAVYTAAEPFDPTGLSAGQFSLSRLDGQNGDVGAWPSLHIVPTTGWKLVSYQDISLGALRYLVVKDTGTEYYVADSGAREDGSGGQWINTVGADTQIAIDLSGTVTILYQDQTDVELLMYRQLMVPGVPPTIEAVAGGGVPDAGYVGAYGFYNALVPIKQVVSFATYGYNLKVDPYRIELLPRLYMGR